jgi:hypothetical protein
MNLIFPNFTYDFNDKNFPGFYKEIVEGDEYNRFGINISEGDVVVDCGANVGIFTRYAIDIRKASQVYAFEMDPTCYSYLLDNTKHNPNVKCFLGRVDVRQQKEEWDIARILNENDNKIINFLKIDIEGSEYKLLLNTPDYIFNQIEKIAIEVHFNIDNNFQPWGHTNPESNLTFKLLEKLSKCGYNLKFEWIHKSHSLGMIYAQKPLNVI